MFLLGFDVNLPNGLHHNRPGSVRFTPPKKWFTSELSSDLPHKNTDLFWWREKTNPFTKHHVTNNGPLDLVFVQVAPLPRPLLCCGLCHGAVTGAITTTML